MAMRQQFGVSVGDGWKRIKQLKEGSEVERELANTLEKVAREALWTMDYFDTIVACYGTLSRLKGLAVVEDFLNTNRRGH
jgi:hypothetical protein